MFLRLDFVTSGAVRAFAFPFFFLLLYSVPRSRLLIPHPSVLCSAQSSLIPDYYAWNQRTRLLKRRTCTAQTQFGT